MFTNESEVYAESEAYDSASVVPIHTRTELSSDYDSAYDSASVGFVASVNQPLGFFLGQPRSKKFCIFKGATSRFVHLEKFSLNFSSFLFAIRVNLLHP